MSSPQEPSPSRDTTNIPLQELQETVSRLSSYKGIESVLILNREGDIIVSSGNIPAVIKTPMNSTPPTPATVSADEDMTAASVQQDVVSEHAKHTKKLLEVATNYLQCLQPTDEVTFMQLRSKNNQELMIAPHQGYVLAVLKRS